MPGFKLKAFIAGTTLFAGFLFVTSLMDNKAHAAACPGLPDVAWWKSSHEKIVQHVDQHYHGKWDIYINRWKDYRDKMRLILREDGTAIVRSRGVKLKGASLELHIRNIETRIRITKCLKEKHIGRIVSYDESLGKSLGLRENGVSVMYEVAKRQVMYLANYRSSGHETKF